MRPRSVAWTGRLNDPRRLCVAPNGSVPALGATNIPYTALLFENQGRNEALSVFADVTWIPTEAVELTAGVRVIDEYRRSGFLTNIPNSQLTGAPLIPGGINTGGRVLEAEETFQAVLPRFNALVRISDDVNVYGTVSKGRRSPVVQVNARRDGTQVLANRFDVLEEIVWNYEGGIKFESGPVSASLGVYYQVYDNFQVSVAQLDANGNPTGAFVTQSAGKASNLGVEAELAVDVTDWLNVFGNIGYIDFKFLCGTEYAGDFYAAMMNYINHTDALIIDFRKCGGAMSDNVISFLCSYFFADKTHLNDLYWRERNFTQQTWTQVVVPGKKYLNKPIYVLTSGGTFSGAEEMAYDLKNLKRATIIGEVTGGGANPGAPAGARSCWCGPATAPGHRPGAAGSRETPRRPSHRRAARLPRA